MYQRRASRGIRESWLQGESEGAVGRESEVVVGGASTLRAANSGNTKGVRRVLLMHRCPEQQSNGESTWNGLGGYICGGKSGGEDGWWWWTRGIHG